MTDKERLEEIDKRAKHRVLENIRGEVRYRLTEINTKDYEWLIEQAERVQELEELVEGYKIELMIKDNAKKRANQQNKRYREALELLVKQETLGKDAETGKTAVSYNGMIALKGLNAFDVDNYIVYGVDEIIESVLEEESE